MAGWAPCHVTDARQARYAAPQTRVTATTARSSRSWPLKLCVAGGEGFSIPSAIDPLALTLERRRTLPTARHPDQKERTPGCSQLTTLTMSTISRISTMVPTTA